MSYINNHNILVVVLLGLEESQTTVSVDKKIFSYGQKYNLDTVKILFCLMLRQFFPHGIKNVIKYFSEYWS